MALYRTLCELREWCVLLADIGILVILILEFNYDKVQNEKQHYKKKKKPRYQFEQLNQGEHK